MPIIDKKVAQNKVKNYTYKFEEISQIYGAIPLRIRAVISNVNKQPDHSNNLNNDSM